jgi:hypothetical protein
MSQSKTNGKSQLHEHLKDLIADYKAKYPKARVDYYLKDDWVRLRFIDPSFKGIGKFARHHRLWKYLERLPDEIVQDLSMLVAITPSERKLSGYNLKYEDELPKPAKSKP